LLRNGKHRLFPLGSTRRAIGHARTVVIGEKTGATRSTCAEAGLSRGVHDFERVAPGRSSGHLEIDLRG